MLNTQYLWQQKQTQFLFWLLVMFVELWSLGLNCDEKVLIYLCAGVWSHMCLLQAHGGQRIAFGNQFSPFLM